MFETKTTYDYDKILILKIYDPNKKERGRTALFLSSIDLIEDHFDGTHVVIFTKHGNAVHVEIKLDDLVKLIVGKDDEEKKKN